MIPHSKSSKKKSSGKIANLLQNPSIKSGQSFDIVVSVRDSQEHSIYASKGDDLCNFGETTAFCCTLSLKKDSLMICLLINMHASNAGLFYDTIFYVTITVEKL